MVKKLQIYYTGSASLDRGWIKHLSEYRKRCKFVQRREDAAVFDIDERMVPFIENALLCSLAGSGDFYVVEEGNPDDALPFSYK